MRLADMLGAIPATEVRGDPGVEVRGVAYDSRAVRPGDLFLAWKGQRFDGHDFLGDALAAGASAVVVERLADVPSPLPPGRAAALVPDARRAAAPLAAVFYGHPTARLGLVGVTGTNGKTTTSYLAREVLSTLGPVGLVGTVSAVVGGTPRAARLTTPEAPDLQALFADMVAAGDRRCVMEVSSMALARHRVDAVAFDIAVFTNLTPDHVGPREHPTLAHYRNSKRRLFEMVGRQVTGAPSKQERRGVAVNADDPLAGMMAAAVAPGVPVLRFGLGSHAELRAEDLRLRPDSTGFTIRYSGGRLPCVVRLPGRFNVSNALAAFCVGVLSGVPAPEAAAALGRVNGVPGRLQRISGAQPFTVLVDYAHTPDGLQNVLQAARELASGEVLAVFGCGGDRDRTKRPRMGEIAARLADRCWLTSDNPRSEPPMAILREIEVGATAVAGARYTLEPDRRQAIGEAIAAAREGDVVVIAGKGHEDYQIFADRTVHFDDREEAEAALARLGHR